MYTGWADPVVPPTDTVAYYEAVAHANSGLDATRDFFRFFPVSGMSHCGGGVGTGTFDALGALERWREQGIAPDVLDGSRALRGRVDRTRPICAYPRVARYRGAGSVDDAASFACVDPGAVSSGARGAGS
jgi:feruloyl esterase